MRTYVRIDPFSNKMVVHEVGSFDDLRRKWEAFSVLLDVPESHIEVRLSGDFVYDQWSGSGWVSLKNGRLIRFGYGLPYVAVVKDEEREIAVQVSKPFTVHLVYKED